VICWFYCVKALPDEVQRGGIAGWKALHDLLRRDDGVTPGPPSVSFSQLFVAAHKEINRLEQTKKPLPVIDVEAEPVANQASDKDVEW
jgi:hypothetical protein